MAGTLSDYRAETEALRIATERLRMLRRWRRHLAASTYRSPPLSAQQQRIADRISLDPTPREALAAAWQAASERDRRDLIAAVTGRAAA